MTEEKSPTLVITVPKDKVRFEDGFAVIDTGLTVEEFIMAIGEFATSPKKAVAAMSKEAEK